MHRTIPVDPDADTAREWARDELSNPMYQEEGTDWLRRFLDWVEDLLSGVQGFGGTLGVPGLVVVSIVVAAVIALILWLVLGPLRRSRRAASARPVFDDDSRSAADMAAAARSAAESGQWDLATVEMFRACVKRADERGLLADAPATTADEAASTIVTAIAEASEISRDALAFDLARYGPGGLESQDFAHVETTWATITGSRAGIGAGA